MTLKTFTESKVAPILVFVASASILLGCYSYLASAASVDKLDERVRAHESRITAAETSAKSASEDHERRFDKVDRQLNRMEEKIDKLPKK